MNCSAFYPFYTFLCYYLGYFVGRWVERIKHDN